MRSYPDSVHSGGPVHSANSNALCAMHIGRAAPKQTSIQVGNYCLYHFTVPASYAEQMQLTWRSYVAIGF